MLEFKLELIDLPNEWWFKANIYTPFNNWNHLIDTNIRCEQVRKHGNTVNISNWILHNQCENKRCAYKRMPSEWQTEKRKLKNFLSFERKTQFQNQNQTSFKYWISNMFYRLQSYYFGLILIILHTKIKGKYNQLIYILIRSNKTILAFEEISEFFIFPNTIQYYFN